MSTKLDLQVEIVNDQAKISLKGIIDEDADFSKVANINQSEYLFDFQEVASINSCGIREWINFINGVDSGAKITYKNCTQVIIEQMGMVKGFLKEGAEIESFYAPYFCEDCDEEFLSHLKTSDVKNKKAPEVKCTKCGGENTEFDALEAQYFSFIKD